MNLNKLSDTGSQLDIETENDVNTITYLLEAITLSGLFIYWIIIYNF